MSILSLIRNAFSGAPKSVTAQPDWLASTKAHAPGSGITTLAPRLPFVSPTARGLSDADLHVAAKSLGCEVAALKAVRQVEAAGDGFLSDGRPKILFEAHWFSKYTKGKYDKSHPDISSKKWNKALYGKGGSNQYVRLNRAIALDREAALKSASWGLWQQMGGNFAVSGFADVEAFVAAMCRDEVDQTMAIVGFIKANPKMHRALVAKDWRTFTRYYNGPGQVDRYSGLIAAAYKRAAAVS